MRTRSSRFFVVLLHLVGVCQDRYRGLFSSTDNKSGIVGVQPWPVQLESLTLSSYPTATTTTTTTTTTSAQGDKDNFQKHTSSLQPPSSSSSSSSLQDHLLLESSDQDYNLEPIWLQDQQDSLCLGPTGTFTECGDATLWFVQRQEIKPPKLQGRDKRMFLSGFWFGGDRRHSNSLIPRQQHAEEAKNPQPVASWTFQVVEVDYYEELGNDNEGNNHHKNKRGQNKKKGGSTGRQRSDCLDRTEDDSTIEVRACPLRRRPWRRRAISSAVWLIDPIGRLQVYNGDRQKVSGEGGEEKASAALCLHRGGSGKEAVLSSCKEGDQANQQEENNATAPVRFAFVRYRTVTVPNSATSSSTISSSKVGTFLQETETGSSAASPEALSSDAIIPSSRDKAHSHATEPQMHPELKLSSQQFLLSRRGKQKRKDQPARNIPFALLKDTNPILLAMPPAPSPAPTSSLLHSPTTSRVPREASSSTMKIRRIATHPYIEKAVNEVWTDPQTNLEYYTDLSRYLGHDRKERGRHTLMGVGQYRKGYVIKVYGVAYYVSKRDVLADPTFVKYSSMTSEQLRQRPDFYRHLRQMDLSESSPTGKFDRTLLLKINMQLSTEAMRSSLQAEWELLTEEAKADLVRVSLQPRQADEEMLKIISSPANPSRCSCSQVAPPEFNADPECCARGTELAFTWLKGGGMEIRLNGRLMHTFESPDIAIGVFYDYLRYDDPISPELRERVVDGFPFLLAPLAQVKGIKMGQHSPTRQHHEENAILRAIGGLAEVMSSQAHEMAEILQQSASEAAENARNSARSLREAAQNFAREMNHRRELVMKNSASFPDAFMSMLSPNRQTLQTVTEWVERNMTPSLESLEPAPKEPIGRVFGYPLSRWFGEPYYHAPDEIGPMKIHPTMNTTRKVFLALVHLYLLLLFIVSFPGSYSTRTKLIVLRKTLSGEFSVHSISSSDGGSKLSNGLLLRRSSEDLLLYEKQKIAGGVLLNQACKALRPNGSEDPGKEAPATGQLKKKSFSYFL